MIYSLIIKNNIVINKTIGEKVLESYPFSYDLILEDVNKNVMIGSTYDPITGTFSVVGAPYPDEEQ